MRILEVIANLAYKAPVMPPRAGCGDIERGVAAVAEAVVSENRERAESSRRQDSRNFKTSLRNPGDCELPRTGLGRSRRRKPDFHAAVPSFPARLLICVKERCDGNGRMAYVRSGVSRQIYSRITSYDDENADKLTVMKFCIGLQLERAAADLLMKSAGYAFSDTLPVDVAFAYAIEHGMWNIHDVDELLVRNSLPGLGLPA